MVIVSHLFSFLGKISGTDVTRMSHICPCLGLSISRQPHLAQKPLWKVSFSEWFYVQSVSITLCWKPFGTINYKMGKLKSVSHCLSHILNV